MKYIVVVYLIVLLISIPHTYAHDMTGFYLEAGISLHSEATDTPEFKGSNPLGNFGFGYSSKVSSSTYVDIYFKHTSSIPDAEVGYGLNQIGVQLRSYLW